MEIGALYMVLWKSLYDCQLVEYVPKSVMHSYNYAVDVLGLFTIILHHGWGCLGGFSGF